MTARVILIGGGARSGKSAFALQRASELGTQRVFIATAQAFDSEMTERITAHQLERGSQFRTVEAPLLLAEAVREHAASADVIVIDCLTLWLSNLLLAELDSSAVAARVDELAAVLARRLCHVLVVTNEVGLGLVPDNALGRLFRDCTGRAHQRIAKTSDEIYVGVLGCLLRLKPGPIELVPGAGHYEETHAEA
jgi:adenosylcobinamide kinase/adenosylcobinamide-phosphate guanylyltransferase